MPRTTLDRETEILDAAARGLTVVETGRELFLSPNTIRTYRKQILERLGAQNMTQAVALWMVEQREPS